MQGYRVKSGLLWRAPCPNRGHGGIPTTNIVMIGTKLVAVMPGGAYVCFELGRLSRVFGKYWYKSAEAQRAQDIREMAEATLKQTR